MIAGTAVFVSYAVGHLLVGLLLYAVWRVLTREADLSGRGKAILELASRERRDEAARLELERAREERDELERRQSAAAALAAERLPLPDSPQKMWAFAALGGIFLELEALVFLLLSASSQLFALGPATWAFFAPPLSFAWVVMLHVLLGAVIGDDDRPARTVRRARNGVIATGAAVILGVMLVLAGRNFPDNPALVEVVAATGLMLLAALVSVCGAFCFIVATTIAESQRGIREQRRLSKLVAAYARHIALVERCLPAVEIGGDAAEFGSDVSSLPGPRASLATVTSSNGSQAGSPGLPAIVPTHVVPFVVMLSLSASALARPALAQTMAPPQVVAVPFAREGSCSVLIDSSGSVNRAARQRALEHLATDIGAVARGFRCQLIQLVTFAAAPVISVEESELPSAPDAPDCRTSEVPPLTGTSVAVRELYPGVAGRRRKDSEDDCRTKHEKEVAVVERQRETVLARVANGLRELSSAESGDRCTDVRLAATRALRRSAAVVVVSDGVSSCPATVPAVRVPAGSQLLMLLLPQATKRGDSRNDIETLAKVEREFQGAQVIFAAEATSSFWQRLSGQR